MIGTVRVPVKAFNDSLARWHSDNFYYAGPSHVEVSIQEAVQALIDNSNIQYEEGQPATSGRYTIRAK